MIGSKVKAILMKKVHFYIRNFVNIFLLPFIKVESQIDWLQKDSLGKSNERTLVSEFAILAQKWSKIITDFF